MSSDISSSPSELAESQKQKKKTRSHSPGGPGMKTHFQPVPFNVGPHGNKTSSQHGQGGFPGLKQAFHSWEDQRT